MHERIESLIPDMRQELEALVRIPSVSLSGFDPSKVRTSAEASADLLERSGYASVRMLEIDGAHPAVYGEVGEHVDGPTVLLYAHHDVQPPGPDDLWRTSPFEPHEYSGRLFGRGTADNKCGVVSHAMMPQLLEGGPKVNLKIFLEGEEEIGSPNLTAFLSTYGEMLDADAIIIADAGNRAVGEPAITTSFRGLVSCIIEVRTASSGMHSGIYGGVAPDALSALVKTLATLHRDDGSSNVAGLISADDPDFEITERELREQLDPVDGLALVGKGSVASRLWSQPSIAVLAIDAPPIDQSINQLVPHARAKVSVRVAPGQDADGAMAALRRHLIDAVPWGVEVTITERERADAFLTPATGPFLLDYTAALREAWGVEPVYMGSGGCIPFVSEFNRTFPKAELLLVGAGDPTSGAHGPNESLDLDDFTKATLAEAIALTAFASHGV